jgi:CBS domain-containing protein
MELLETIGSLLNDKGGAVWTAVPEMPVYAALDLMAKKGVGALPVLSGGVLVGMISERDYARKVILKGKSSRDTPVGEIMTSPALAVSPENTVDECMRLMTDYRVRHLAVVENDRFVGIVSIGDLVNWIINSQEKTIRQLHHYIAGAYPV